MINVRLLLTTWWKWTIWCNVIPYMNFLITIWFNVFHTKKWPVANNRQKLQLSGMSAIPKPMEANMSQQVMRGIITIEQRLNHGPACATPEEPTIFSSSTDTLKAVIWCASPIRQPSMIYSYLMSEMFGIKMRHTSYARFMKFSKKWYLNKQFNIADIAFPEFFCIMKSNRFKA